MEQLATVRRGRRKAPIVLDAEPIPPDGMKGGSSRKGHVWVERAHLPFACEGLNPLSSARRFAANHEHIQVGEKYLKKWWRASDHKTDFLSRHCVACGREINPSD